MLDFDSLTILIGIIILVLINLFLRYKKKKSVLYLTFYSIFFIYILYVIKYTIFPIPIQGPWIEEMKRMPFFSNLNTIPFNFKTFYQEQIILNIILTIPFGFGISYIFKTSWKRIFYIGVLLGATIELLQFLISLLVGFLYRTIDINDIILNFLGVIIGYIIFKIFSQVFLFSVGKYKIKLSPFLEYIYIISKGDFPN
ncbi:VanZ family protein [Tepidibacillus fermentans]|uniref:VanZ like protein n=1 Tax=Tepidibacillus fermentans TaxID=1281767 RepID=A0A4R3KIJ9_9BACI|nr:VanZ family protein [Tepidibacillus fermentans]TCS83094.1 VanZ like protein [Tepidibacillus fermentans]